MHTHMRSGLVVAGVALWLLTAGCALSAPQPLTPQQKLDGMRNVTPAMLRDPAPSDWLQWGRTQDGHNVSPLRQINRQNVADLRTAWSVPLAPGLSMPTPIVHDGVMFLQTSPDTVLALDASNGDLLWRFVHIPKNVDSTMKMGLSLSGDMVLVPTSDLHVIALNIRTGEKMWDHEIALSSPATNRARFGLRSAPQIVGNKVIQGVTASNGPGGGFILGLDLASGREVWRFHTIPRPGEPGGETWNGVDLEHRTGGSVWHQGTYDPELNLIFYGVAPTYDTGLLRQPSNASGMTTDALYTNSTLALDPDTGRLVWHYQHLANDQWDLDWVFERQIASIMWDGGSRKVVMNVGKMGILDVLDAATGAYLFSIDAGTQNVVEAIDPVSGAKTINPLRLPDPARPTVVCPGPSGARSWPPTSFSAKTGVLFVPITEWCMGMSKDGYALLSAPGAGLTAADHPDAVADGKMGRLQAMDLIGRKLSWRHDLEAPISTSVLATEGGVVFAGDIEPSLKAFDDRDGKLIWQAPLDGLPTSSIITYSAGGRQYVALVQGMSNNHVSDLRRRFAAFRRSRGGEAVAAMGRAAVRVFGLP
jgi:alcohol dehydrogenase (cytochrome c)